MSTAPSRSIPFPTTAPEPNQSEDTLPIQVRATPPRHGAVATCSTESARAYTTARDRHTTSPPSARPRRLFAVPQPVADSPLPLHTPPVPDPDHDAGLLPGRAPFAVSRVTQQLKAATSGQHAMPPVKPRELHPPPTALQRLKRGIAAPISIAVLILGGVLVGAIALVVIRTPIPVFDDAASQYTAAAETQVPDAKQPAKPSDTAVSPTADTKAGGSSPGATIYAHVVGAVHQPGVVEIAEGARVLDALEAAGGATDTAVTTHVNLARKVVDGEQIQVPDIHDPEPVASSSPDTTPSNAGSRTRILLNAATQAELETLPRIGPALAQRILEWRDANGGFTTVDQLTQVPGIGDKLLAALTELVSV